MSHGRLLCICKNVMLLNICKPPIRFPFMRLSSSAQTNNATPEVIKQTEATVNGTAEEIPGRGPPPVAPTHCCMSGCNNCVWIDYVEKLTDYYQDGGQRALAAVDKIEDVTVRTFMEMMLR